MSKKLFRVYRAVACALMGAAFVVCSSVGSARGSVAQARALDPEQIFVQLREAARRNDPDRAAQLAALIPDYPVRSYLEYFQIKPQLFDSSGHARVDAPDEPVLAFLRRYDGQAIADRMRNDYLLVLGARHDWRAFRDQYRRFVLDDDTRVKCYALEARAARGENVAAEAGALLTDPRKYGDGCVDLLTFFAQHRQISTDDVWQQIRQAYEVNETDTGDKIADALGGDKPSAELYAMAGSAPPLFFAQGIHTNTGSHQLALLAITVMARNDPARAAATYASVSPRLTPQERAIGWGAIAFQAALKQTGDAVDWYRLSVDAALSTPAYEWRVRSALLAGDWTMVRWAIEQMPSDLRAKPSWVYWYGRALAEAGAKDQALEQYRRIAGSFDFYGQLASEELGQRVSAPPPVRVRDSEVEQMRTQAGFQLSQKFYALNLRLEGNREWNWTLRGMSDRQLIAAAEFARRIQLYDRAVNTAERTRTQHDFSLRYLAPFRGIVERDAQSNGLDVEWAYGLIRQESRFIINARSGVGATGLMQLMPATAQLVASKIGLGRLTRAQMNDIDTNILLGTNYLSMLYQQLDSSPVLASAGYNAGPGRPQTWRQTLPHPVEGAIFAEAIPFPETRDYVQRVLANTVCYAALFEGKPQSLKERLGIITP